MIQYRDRLIVCDSFIHRPDFQTVPTCKFNRRRDFQVRKKSHRMGNQTSKTGRHVYNNSDKDIRIYRIDLESANTSAMRSSSSAEFSGRPSVHEKMLIGIYHRLT